MSDAKFDQIKLMIEEWVDNTLRYNGVTDFTITFGHMKVIIELSSGESTFFLYSRRNTMRRDVVGAVQMWLMDRKCEDE